MQTQNWLYDYRLKEGIAKAFNGLVYRAKYLQESAIAFELFTKNYDQLREYYLEFFPELKEYTLTMISNLTPR